MKISEETRSQLELNDFNFHCKLPLPSKANNIVDRAAFLLDLVKQKNVMHIGFAGHPDKLLATAKKGSWLHGNLIQATNYCVGVDISIKAIELAQKELGVANLYHFNIESDALPEELKKDHWDYILLGQTLEHLGNPQQFLSRIKEELGPYSSNLVVTVPNAISYGNFYNVIIHNQEAINVDHRYWFTPYTLAKIGFDAGFFPQEFYYCHNPQKKWWKRRLYQWRPSLRSTLVMIFSTKV